MHWSSYPVPLGTGEPNGIGCTRSLHTVLNLLLFDRTPPSADAPSVDARRDSTALHTLPWPHQRPSSSPMHPSRPSTSRGGHCLRIYPTNMYITYLLESKLRGLTGHKKRHSAEASHARPHARTAVLPPSGPPVQAQRPALRPLPPLSRLHGPTTVGYGRYSHGRSAGSGHTEAAVNRRALLATSAAKDHPAGVEVDGGDHWRGLLDLGPAGRVAGRRDAPVEDAQSMRKSEVCGSTG